MEVGASLQGGFSCSLLQELLRVTYCSGSSPVLECVGGAWLPLQVGAS